MKSFGRFVAVVITVPCLALPYSASAEDAPRVVHVFVALCDNESQGIVPVPAALGNGDDARNNLYWGALYGVKTFFKKSPKWELIATTHPSPPILERCVFKHRSENVYLVADAYQGREIKRAVIDFLEATSGIPEDEIEISSENEAFELAAHGKSDLTIYVGHDGLMDFRLDSYPKWQGGNIRDTMILACISKTFFRDAIAAAKAKPLVWTTGLMAPEAYTLENAIEGWVLGESDEQIRVRAAAAYDRYQKCGLNAAKRLFVKGM
jgi:hypothetical protein